MPQDAHSHASSRSLFGVARLALLTVFAAPGAAGCALVYDFSEFTAAPDAAVAPELDAGSEPVSHLPAPTVEGEPSAGHARPAFRWAESTGAQAFGVRLDGGEWIRLPATQRLYVTPSDLPEGEHRFEVRALDEAGLWTVPGSFVTRIEYFAREGFWNGAARTLAMTPHGHACAVSAHNTYVTSAPEPDENLALTVGRIHEAQQQGADIVELDIKDEAGAIVVGHEDGLMGGPLLADVLDDDQLRQGDQILFIELKEITPTAEFARGLLDLLEARRGDYARNGRPVVLRAFREWQQGLRELATALEDEAYVLIRPYVRLSILFQPSEDADIVRFQDLVAGAAADRYGMVEFQYQTPNLHALLAYARDLGLGINLWTIPEEVGEVFVAGLREETDVVTTDYPVAKARAVVEDDTALFYLNVRSLVDPATTLVEYLDDASQRRPVEIGTLERPTLRLAPSRGSLFGGYLEFDAGQRQYLPLYDADASSSEGVLVSAVVRFRSFAGLTDGGTQSILAKSELGAWLLEIHDPDGEAVPVLRFGVRVADRYVFATKPLSQLSIGPSYTITGAYDGDGGVWLWVDNANTGVTNGAASGGIVNNDVPILVGADPQGSGPTRFHADIDVQMVMGQRWGPH